ncbi:MAG: nucleotidyltransferase domain-containing protein [Saprospiraceae bacterium]|nr:nucleotidyltransferase domain-containing protein [Saprospiraceae bacterium]
MKTLPDTGLCTEDVQLLLDCIRINPSVEKIILFGSRARGNYRPGSDIDLALSGDQLTKEDLDRIAMDVDDLLLPYHVDLVRTNLVADHELATEIQQWGVSLDQLVKSRNGHS